MDSALSSGISFLIGIITELVDESLDWMYSFMGFVENDPVLVIFIMVSLVGLGIGLIQRLLRLHS